MRECCHRQFYWSDRHTETLVPWSHQSLTVRTAEGTVLCFVPSICTLWVQVAVHVNTERGVLVHWAVPQASGQPLRGLTLREERKRQPKTLLLDIDALLRSWTQTLLWTVRHTSKYFRIDRIKYIFILLVRYSSRMYSSNPFTFKFLNPIHQ